MNAPPIPHVDDRTQLLAENDLLIRAPPRVSSDLRDLSISRHQKTRDLLRERWLYLFHRFQPAPVHRLLHRAFLQHHSRSPHHRRHYQHQHPPDPQLGFTDEANEPSGEGPLQQYRHQWHGSDSLSRQ
jgi:hypothetical protein